MEALQMAEAALVTVYALTYRDGDRKRSAILQSSPTGEGVIMDENPVDSGIMEGWLVSGGRFTVPMVDIVTILPMFWKKKFFTGRTTKTVYYDEKAVERNLDHITEDSSRWTDGVLNDLEGVDEKDIPSDGKIIRG